MPLAPGDKIGPYEILSPLGAGGMGEVYRARDPKLNREVAIKVLPASLANDADYLTRFQREAQSLAALNHPNIATIFGLEQNAIVMELIEGQTLQGPRSLAEALPIAKQIAEALEAAHDKGIIHRDLKPANIKLTLEGVVKVLDFGLAKAIEKSATPTSADSPTLTVRATQAGLILGTAGYMSPEQAAGKLVDRRADIWGFGVVIWELITGKRLFNGETISHTLADVIKGDIDFNEIPAGPIRDLIRRCLDRNIKSRLQHIGEARIAIDGFLANPKPSDPITSQATRLPWVIAAVLFLLATAAFYTSWRASMPVLKPLLNLTLDLGPDAQLDAVITGPNFLLSPDGTRIAYIVKNPSGIPVLATRTLDQDQLTFLQGTEYATSPFFSPDGQWIAFTAAGKLKKIAVSGGSAFTLCDSNALRGGTWTEDGHIIAALDIRDGLSILPATGGTPTGLTKLVGEERTHRWPKAIPGGVVLFSSNSTPGNYENSNIEVFSPKTGQRKVLHRGGYFPFYSASGHLLFFSQGVLFAAALNLDRLELTTAPIPIPNNVQARPGGGSASIHLSDSGTLLLRKGSSSVYNQSLVWLDKAGKMERIPIPPAAYRYFQLSPDGKRISLANEAYSLSIYDLEQNTLNTIGGSASSTPLWSPSLSHVIYRSESGIVALRSDGGGKVQRLTSVRTDSPNSLSPDASQLFFHRDRKYWSLPLDWSDPAGPKPGTARILPLEGSREGSASVSPDGRWIAYKSDEAGRFEIFVRANPSASGGGGKWQISSDESSVAPPVWSPNGKELLYRNQQSQIMVVPYTATRDAFIPSKPYIWEILTQFNGVHRFDISHDGKRLLLSANPDSAKTETPLGQLVMQLNFSDELKRRVTTSK